MGNAEVSRPRSVTFLALAVLLLAAVNLLGAVNALRRYTLLSELGPSLPPEYLMAANALWAVVFGALAVGLWRLKPWARLGALAAVTLYLGVTWVERLAFGQSDYVRVTVPYYLGIHAVSLAYVWGTLLRRKVRASFAQSGEGLG